MILHQIAITAVLLFGSGNTSTNTLKESLKKARAFYEKSDVLYMRTSITGYPERGRAAVSLGTAEHTRDGNRYYTKILKREMYCDGKRILSIDHAHKKVTLYEHFNAGKFRQQQSIPVDSLMKRIAPRDSLVNISDRKNAFRIYHDGNAASYTGFVFDEKEFYLKEYDYTINVYGFDMESEYRSIKVKYENVTRKPPKKINYDIGQFVDGSGKNIRLNEKKLNGYKLKVKDFYYEGDLK